MFVLNDITFNEEVSSCNHNMLSEDWLFDRKHRIEGLCVCKYGFEHFNYLFMLDPLSKKIEVVDTSIDSDSGHVLI